MNLRKLAMAFAVALAVSGLCTLSLGRRLSSNAAEQMAPRHYVAPARSLQANEVLKADSLTLVDWPKNLELVAAFTRPEDLVGRVVLYPVEKGQPITERLVSTPGAGIGLAVRIPEGMRAIALRTDEVIGVAGFLVPGSRLDLLATYHAGSTSEPLTATVLQNAEVLAIGHQIQPEPEGKGSPVTVVTLLLSPEDAEKAVMASTQGTIHFVMRSGSDSRVHINAPVQLSALTGGATAPRQQAPTKMHNETRTRVIHPKKSDDLMVETILGETKVTTRFQVPTL